MSQQTAGALETNRVETSVDLLIVDDNPAKRLALRTVLSPLGQHVVEAASGPDALRQLLRQDFAVILLDVRMPVMDGFETARLIRGRLRSEHTPIIFVTALDRAETDMARGYELGAVDFVFSPVVPAVMRAKVGVFVELHRAQQELRRYRTQLEQLVEQRTVALTAMNQELEAFRYSMSHDLRGPLVAFDRLNLALLNDSAKQIDDRLRGQLERIHAASKRIVALFDGLQRLFQLTGGEIHREEVDLTAMAAEIVQELRATSPSRKVKVDIAEGLSVSADPQLARILVANLINNAWKFTGKTSNAAIAVGREIVDGEEHMFVRDNGVGFDMIYAHKLFGAFQRLHAENEFPGTGIGLAAVRRIINRHGGRVWAEGQSGIGATFSFVL